MEIVVGLLYHTGVFNASGASNSLSLEPIPRARLLQILQREFLELPACRQAGAETVPRFRSGHRAVSAS